MKKTLGSKGSTTGGRRIFGLKIDFLGFLKLASFMKLTCIWALRDIYGRLKLAIPLIKKFWSTKFSELDI